MRFRLFLSVLLSLLYCRTFPQYTFDSWTTDNGLPQNGVREIVQTPDGYLWFTTFDGLVRFDGVRFTTFDKRRTKGILSNRFKNLSADKQGTLWSGTEDGALTICRDGTFTSFTASQLPGSFYGEFSPDSSGEMRIRFETRQRPLGAWYYLRNGQFDVSSKAPRPHDQILFRGREGTEWSIRQDGLTQRKNGAVTSFAFARIFFRFEPFEDASGNLWIGGYGLHLLRNGVLTQLSGRNGLPALTNYHSFWQESDSSVWFATGDNSIPGIGLVQYKDGQFHTWGEQAGLSNDRIFDVFKDNEGSVWLATNKGLNRLRRKAVTGFAEADALTDKEVYPILQEANGDIWIGGEKLWRYRNGGFETIINRGLSVRPLTVQSLFKDRNGVLWIGVVGGLYLYENKKLLDVPELDQISCKAIHQDRNGDVWIATAERGVVQFREGKIIARYSTPNGLPSNDVKAILEDHAGTLWFGTHGGLVRFREGRFTTFTSKDGLASNLVRSLYQDAEGVLWIGTYDGGLTRLKNGKLFSFTTEQGLFNNGVFATLEDGRGNFWISCNRGIYRVSKNELNAVADGKLKAVHSIPYGKEDGMLNTECNGGRQPAGIVAHDGRIWFPTQQGVAVIDPSAVQVNTISPSVVIEEVHIDREPVHARDGVDIPPGKSYLEISYTAASFINPRQVRFKYRLDGFDNDWVDAGTRRTAYYTHIPHGRYSFHVLAANSDGIWSPESAQLSIVVRPAYYQTWWFALVSALLLVGLAVTIYYRRITQLKRERRQQEEYARQILETQEAERKRIAGELHDSLGQNLLVIKNRSVLAAQAINDNPRATRHLNEIAATITEAIAEVRHISQNLHPYQLEVIGLSAAIRSMLTKVAESSPIAITGEIDEIDDMIEKKEEINLYRIVQEGLNNVLKHAEATHASVFIRRSERHLEIRIGDDGKGFATKPAGQPGGRGLRDIAERVHLLSGTHTIDSTPGSGTIIQITIPIKLDAA